MTTSHTHTAASDEHTPRATPERRPLGSQPNLWKSGLERKDPTKAAVATEEWLRDFRSATDARSISRAA